jgi:hypothetical protein
MTYTSRYQLEKRARSGQGRDRLQHLQSLVTEFQDTKRKEFKHQVLANLANFAYDPVNYEYFRQLNVLDLFLDVIAEETDNKLIEFAIGGICNCCLDKQIQSFLLQSDCIEQCIKCLKSTNQETVLSAITTLIYLITPQSKRRIVRTDVCSLMQEFTKSPSKRLQNLSQLFLEDYCA